MKLKKTLLSKIQEEQKQKDRYKKEYGIEDENVVVVEKSNTFKFTINTFIKLIKLVLNILAFLFALIGVYALIEPSIRNTLLEQTKALSQYLG